MEAGKIEDPLSQVLDIFGSLGDSLNILADETTPDNVVIEPLDEVIETFGQLGDSLDVLNDDATAMWKVKMMIEPVEESFNAFDPVEALHS